MEPVYDRVARDLEAVKASVTPLKTGDHGPGDVVVGRTVADVVEPPMEQGRRCSCRWFITRASGSR